MSTSIFSRTSASSRATAFSLLSLAFSLACSSVGDDDATSDGNFSTGGSSMVDGSSGGATGGDVATGGSLTASGGNPGAGGGNPVDCSPITEAGFELCEAHVDSCGAVFTKGEGCSALCAAAGLTCEAAFENVDDACAANDALPTLPCDSGHQSDYCVCRGATNGSGGSGSGGAGSGGSSSGGSGGSGGGDCNDIVGQPILEVVKDGSGDFTTVQAALNSVSKSNTTPTVIRIAPGTYTEKLVIDRPHVTLCGQTGRASETILSYGDGASTPNGNGGTVGTSGSASVNLSASNVSAENLTFANSRGPGIQAVALLVTGNRVQFRDCRFTGHQDTLYVKNGTQYFKDCYVEGTVDFIFGGATAVFDECTIHSVSGGSAITAPSTEQSIPFGLVFLGGELTAASGVKSGSIALGRNWHAYGSTTFIETELGAHVSAVGWVPMGENTLATARFAEFETTGPGSKPSQRAPQSSQLSSSEAAEYTVDTIFSDWDPSFSH